MLNDEQMKILQVAAILLSIATSIVVITIWVKKVDK